MPHRSLSPKGVRILCGSLVGLSSLIALRFWLLGAWPVLAISGPEILLVLFLLRLNVRRARASELVMMTGDNVTITRTTPSGERGQVVLPVAWLNVVLEEAPNRIPRLLLRNRSAVQEIARALGEDEKRELADALRTALHKARHPTFDNAQLRADA